MSKITDAKANATSLDGLVNDNGLITTLRNGPKPSWQYIVDQVYAQLGYAVAGSFVDGFTYTGIRQVGADASGNTWIYTGGEQNLPHVVPAGTVPSAPDYFQVSVNSADNVVLDNGENLQQAIDRLNLEADEIPNNRRAIEAMYKDQGYNNVFFFADGFTYTESNDVGIYEDGTAWTYADAGALPVTIAAGTAPSEGVYSPVNSQIQIWRSNGDIRGWGAVGDYDVNTFTGTDDTAAFESAVSDGVVSLKLEDGKSYKTNTIPGLSSVEITGNNASMSRAGVYPVSSSKRYGKIEKPSEFDWFSYNIYYNADGSGSTDLKPADLMPTGKRYYVGFSGASNSNSGLSPSESLANIANALAKSDVDEVILNSKRYNRPEAVFGYYDMSRSIALRCLNGRAELTGADNLTWTVNTTYSNVYQANRSSLMSAAAVWDAKYKDENGDYLKMEEVASISDVASTFNSYYTDGSVVYVRTYDDRAADEDILAFLDVSLGTAGNGGTFYMENLDIAVNNTIFRSNPATGDGSKTKIVGVNCTFKYSVSTSNISGGSGSFRTEGCDSYMFNCQASSSFKDGFNYHEYGTNFPLAFELNCKGINNGDSTTTDDVHNGSTMHQGGSVIRLNGEYFGNKGPNLPDVGLNTSSLMVGVSARDSVKTSNSRNFDFYSGSNPTEESRMKAYLIGVKSSGSDYDISVPADSFGNPQAIVRYYDSQLSRNPGKQEALVNFSPFF